MSLVVSLILVANTSSDPVLEQPAKQRQDSLLGRHSGGEDDSHPDDIKEPKRGCPHTSVAGIYGPEHLGALLLLLPIVVLSLGFAAAGPSGSEDSTPPGDTRPVGKKVENPTGPGPVELVFLVAGLPSALYLGWQLRRDPAASPTES